MSEDIAWNEQERLYDGLGGDSEGREACVSPDCRCLLLQVIFRVKSVEATELNKILSGRQPREASKLSIMSVVILKVVNRDSADSFTAPEEVSPS